MNLEREFDFSVVSALACRSALKELLGQLSVLLTQRPPSRRGGRGEAFGTAVSFAKSAVQFFFGVQKN